MSVKSRKLWICGICVDVRLHSAECLYEGERVFGSYDKDNEAIDIDVRVPPKVWVKSLIHEVGHAGIQAMQGAHQLAGAKDIEEVYVRIMELTYYTLLIDKRNAWLWREIEKIREGE